MKGPEKTVLNKRIFFNYAQGKGPFDHLIFEHMFERGMGKIQMWNARGGVLKFWIDRYIKYYVFITILHQDAKTNNLQRLRFWKYLIARNGSEKEQQNINM